MKKILFQIQIWSSRVIKYFDQLSLINKRCLKINHAIDHRNVFNKTFDSKKKVVFSGSVFFKKDYHRDRLDLLYKLKSQIDEIDIFGNLNFHKNLENIFRIKDLYKFFYIKKKSSKALYGIDYFMNLSNYKICINTHLDNDRFWKYTFIRGTGSGCCVLTNHNRDINKLFEEDKVVTYKNKYEALEKLKWLLNNEKN